MNDSDPPAGRVYLIGAGPGDPGLLTLRGAELLGRSDVVLYDGLCNPEILQHARRAEHICVGKHGQSRIWNQDEIVAEILNHARAGRSVARLKGGDPAVFARTAEEVQALHQAGVSVEVVPGITAALAAGSYAGIPVTHRKYASAVALVTGHEEPGKTESALDWDALARFPGTLVIYMGVTTAAVWTKALMDAGKSPDTPAALIRRCSHPDQQTVRCRLADVAEQLVPASKMRPPVIVILGKVTELASTMNWVERRPLFGTTVLVTRPADQAESLARLLRDQGATVYLQPAIQTGPPHDWGPVDAAIQSLATYDSVVFCSQNGVRYFLQRMISSGLDGRAFGHAKIAVVGSQTAKSLADFHLQADIIPTDFRAESLAGDLAPNASGSKVLIIRASRGRDVLKDALENAGADVDQVIAYSHQDVAVADKQIVQLASAGKIDWITVASSATAENLQKMFGSTLGKSRIASLSPVTSQTLADLGIKVSAEASSYTMQGLVEAIIARS